MKEAIEVVLKVSMKGSLGFAESTQQDPMMGDLQAQPEESKPQSEPQDNSETLKILLVEGNNF
jgi:hypothetical protein